MAGLESKYSPAQLLRHLAKRRRSREAPTKSYTPHEPYEKQKQFLALDCLEALYGGAAGGGKSDALLMSALQYVHVPGYSAILLRRTYADLALPGAIMDRAQEWLAGSAARWVDREKTWIFPSGATLSFGYLANIRDHFRYQGSEFQFVGFDELTQFLESQYRYLFSRLRRLAGVDVPLRMRAGTNPGGIGHDWVKKRFITTPANRMFVPAKLTDNPHIDQVSYRQALDELDAATKAQLLEGLWVRDSTGLVYKIAHERNVIDRLPKLPRGEEWITVLGIDYGNVDATALSAMSFTKHKRQVFVRKSQAWKSLAPSDAADIVKKWEQHYKFDRIVGDVGGLGKGYAAEAQKRYGLPIKAAQKNDKLGYIKLFNGALEKGEIVFVEKYNEELIAEMGSLAWKDDQQLAEHPAMSNHLCDATLYGWRETYAWHYEPRAKEPEVGTLEHAKMMEADIDWGEDEQDEKWFEA